MVGGKLMKTWYLQAEREVYINKLGHECVDWPKDAFWDTYVHDNCDVGLKIESVHKPLKITYKQSTLPKDYAGIS